MAAQWGSEIIAVHGQVFHPAELPGFIAEGESDSGMLGLVTYRFEGGDCEIITLDSLQEGVGIGSALIERVKEAARDSGCAHMGLITTNDNLHALGFYQKRGFRIVRIDAGAVERSRKIKPEIPEIGNGGIPIRDEIDLEKR